MKRSEYREYSFCGDCHYACFSDILQVGINHLRPKIKSNCCYQIKTHYSLTGQIYFDKLFRIEFGT